MIYTISQDFFIICRSHMPALHNIDDELKLITTVWSGVASDTDLIDALLKYQQEIKCGPAYAAYNEIVDFRKAADFTLSAEGIVKLARAASSSDVPGVKTKLAIIVTAPVAYGLGRMYEVYRSLAPGVAKEVRVFKTYEDAFAWIMQGAGSYE